MNKKLTDIMMVVDRSGSMGGLEEATIKGFNKFIEEQKRLPGEAFLSTVLFDHTFIDFHDRLDLKDVKPMTREDYCVDGSTALYDAVGRSIKSCDRRVAELKKKRDKKSKNLIPSKFIVAIITDGQENASKEFTRSKISALIKEKEKLDWSFIYLPASGDAFLDAEKMGIDLNNKNNITRNYDNTEKGLSVAYCSISENIGTMRAGISENRPISQPSSGIKRSIITNTNKNSKSKSKSKSKVKA